jgi:hypothetical protein
MRASAGLAGNFLFMEDDFLFCPHALRALAYVTNKAHAYFPGTAVLKTALISLQVMSPFLLSWAAGIPVCPVRVLWAKSDMARARRKTRTLDNDEEHLDEGRRLR